MRLKGYLLAILSSASYGTIPLFALPLKALGVSVDTTLTYRFLTSALFIGLYLVFRKENFRVSFRESIPLLLLGALFASSAFFLFTAFEYMPAGIAATILFLYPVFVALIMTFIYKEKASWVMWLSIALSLIGVYLLNGGSSDSKIPLIGFIFAVGSAVTYALYMIVINKSAVSTMSGPKLTFYAMLSAGLIFFVKSLAQGSLQTMPNTEAWINVAMLALLSTVVSCIAMVYAVQYVGSTITAVLGALEPVVAVVIGVGLFNEPLTTGLIVGITLILIAVTLIVLSGRIVNEAHNARVYITARIFSRSRRNNRRK